MAEPNTPNFFIESKVQVDTYNSIVDDLSHSAVCTCQVSRQPYYRLLHKILPSYWTNMLLDQPRALQPCKYTALIFSKNCKEQPGLNILHRNNGLLQ